MPAAVLAMTSAAAVAQTPTRLTGVVRDSADAPLADVEVVLRNTSRGTRTNSRGQFTLDDVDPGTYRVWFRRLGYRSVEYTWVAVRGQGTEIAVGMSAIPRTLDPVVVRAEEDRAAASRASLLGLVIDPNQMPVGEAEVQLVGANMYGTTRSNGGFLFKPLDIGTYAVRVRKLGFAPTTATVQLLPNDDREIVIVLQPLATNLDPTVVTEKSGYGKDQRAWDELEQRKRWTSFKTRFLGPGDLEGYHGVDLEVALIRMGLNNPHPNGPPPRPTSINPAGTRPPRQTPNLGLSCLLLNGTEAVYMPLRTYSTDDLELLEVYPPGTEISGTIAPHFHNPACLSNSLFDHPTYYVLWFKNRN